MTGRGGPPEAATARLDQAGRGLLRAIAEAARLFFDAEAVSIFSVADGTGELVFEAVSGAGESHLPGARLPPGTGIVGRVAAGGPDRPVPGGPYPRPDHPAAGAYGRPQGVMATPIVQDGRCVGVMAVLAARHRRGDRRVLAVFTEQAKITLGLLLPGPATGAGDGPADALVQRIAGQLRSAPPPAADLARKLLAIVDEILGGPAG